MLVSLGVRARSAQMLDAFVSTASAHQLDRMWLYDSARCVEAVAGMTYLTTTHPSLSVGVAVANTETRHVAVLANAVATMSNLASGRVVLGIGRGDSALKFLGRSPTAVAELERRLDALRTLLRGDPVELGGRRYRLPDPPHHHVPILLSVQGPRSSEMAGRLADGAIMPMAAHLESFYDLATRVRASAVKAGRDPDALEICGWLHGGLGRTNDEARQVVLPEVGRSLAAAVLSGPTAASWHTPTLGGPERARIAELARNQSDERRLGEEILAICGDALLWDLTVSGTPAACQEKVKALAQVPGVTELAFNIYPPDGTGDYVRAVLDPLRAELK